MIYSYGHLNYLTFILTYIVNGCKEFLAGIKSNSSTNETYCFCYKEEGYEVWDLDKTYIVYFGDN